MTMLEGMVGLHLVWMLIVAAIVVVPFWRICRKAGYPGGLSLLILIPLVNLVFLYFLAFSQWPAHRTFR
ncbi:hypothetical protein [Aquisalimonas sp.]|uniref:hypothetical protein n=1 Tax=unclassified Aquisalimonas TaxID=2644645 RepID=UPI0025BF88E0|nr:hypothetical protein [Aquisalimonas sp.]